MKKYLFLFILFAALGLFCAAPAAHAAPAYVQSKATAGLATKSSIGLKFTSTPTVNNLIIGVGIWGSTSGNMSCADTNGNSYATLPVAHDNTNGNSLQICYAVVASATANFTVTSTLPSGASNAEGFSIYEYSGLATASPLDVSSQKISSTGCSGTNCVTSNASTTSQSGELIFGTVSSGGGGQGTITKGTPFTARSSFSGGDDLSEEMVQSAAGSVSSTFTFGTSNQSYVAIMGTFKAAAGAPDATSASTTLNGDGAKSGDPITITGSNFGAPTAGNRATCTGAGNGCIQFINGGNDTVAATDITAWTANSITFTVSSTLASNGGTNALQVWAAGASDATPLTFYIYPSIGSVSVSGSVPNAARIYNAGDTDGVIKIIGDHFGASGTSTILTIGATLHNTTTSVCNVAGYVSTSACFEVPPTIASNTYTGNIILNRTSDNKQASTSVNSFSILPRITSISPASTSIGNVVQILGDHFCQTGTCPGATSTTANNVKFGSDTSTISDFVDHTGGAGACNGSASSWAHGEICVQVPAVAPNGSAPIVVTSNTNTSNSSAFTVNAPPTPGTPGTPTYTNNNATNTVTVNWTAASGVVSYYTPQRSTSPAFTSPTSLATTTATSSPDSGLTANTTYYYRVSATNTGGTGSNSATSSVLTLPDIVTPAPTYSNVAATTLTVNWTIPTNGAAFYTPQRSTSPAFTSPTSLATTTATSSPDSGLTAATTYYYRIISANATGNGAASATSSVTTGSANLPPSVPSLDSPANNAQDLTTTPTFKMTATDTNGDNLQYKVTIYYDPGCTSMAQTDNQSITNPQTGWSNQNASSSKEYTTTTQAIYVVQGGNPLLANTPYYWKASAIDPEGSNTWTDSACSNNAFTTSYGTWTTDSGSWAITGNQLVVTPASGALVQLRAPGQTQTTGVVEFEVKSSVQPSSGRVAGIIRADSGSNRYHLATADFLNGQVAIGKTVTNAYTSLAAASSTLSASTFYYMRGYITGTSPATLKSWVNGGHALAPSADTGPSTGAIGLIASSTNGSATFTIDDFAMYASPVITMGNLPVGGCWGLKNFGGTVVASTTAAQLDLSTYIGQVPLDYDNGGGTVAVWTNSSCTGTADQASGISTSTFGGDTYNYTPTGTSVPATPGGISVASSTITITSAGAINY